MRASLLLLPLVYATAAFATADLVVDESTLATGIGVELQSFGPAACELQPADYCVGAPGVRKVLRFSVMAVNQGDTDLVVGSPQNEPNATFPNGDPKWVFSQCHNHYHFLTFARYELRERGGSTPVLTGQKRSFCVEDTRRATATSSPKYCCNPGPACENPLQGVQVGWGDLYPSNLPCQWIDITDAAVPGTDLPPGEYDLCVFLNTAGYLDEQPQDNDSTCVPVTIDAPQKPAPRVKVLRPKATSTVRPGTTVKLTWKKKLHGKFQSQDVFWSRDGGTTWEFVATTTKPGGKVAWAVPADAATDAAVVRVAVWQRFPKTGTTAGAFQRGVADSAVFRIAP